MLTTMKWLVKEYFSLLTGVLVGSVISTLVSFALLSDVTDIKRIEQIINYLKDCEG